MTIASVMGTERPKWTYWRFPGPRRPDHALPPRPDRQTDEDEPLRNRSLRPATEPENDVALARMLGCAFLIGLATIVGLLMLIF